MNGFTALLQNLRLSRRNWKAVALCFLAATIFWFFNALNKNYSTNINFPLSFEYDEERYVAVAPLPTQVRINVTGIGWDLFRRSVGLNMPPLVIPLERASEIKKIVPVPGLFAHQLERFDINFVLSDTLRIAVEPIEKRWITLRLDAKALKLAEGYVRISEPELDPDSILITGPAPLVKSFIEPVYLKLGESNIDEDYNEHVEVELLHNNLVQRDPPTVKVMFDIDRMVTRMDSIPLRVINYPAEANPYLGIRALPVRYAVPESLVNSYPQDSVFAVVDLKNFVRGTRQIRPTVVGLPPYAIVHHIDSVYVKF